MWFFQRIHLFIIGIFYKGSALVLLYKHVKTIDSCAYHFVTRDRERIS